jgi:hypothetical protein
MIVAPGVYATTFRENGRRVIGLKVAGRYLVIGWFWSWT